MVQVHDLGMQCLRDGSIDRLLDHVLDASMTLCSATAGGVYLREGETGELRLRSRRALPADLTSLFVADWVSADGETLAEAGVAEDIGLATIPEQRRSALLSAGLIACHRTALRATDGAVLGTIETYCGAPTHPTAAQSSMRDSLARQVADFLQERQTRERLDARFAQEREARQRAEAAVRWRDDFLATLAHELRQPLGAALPAVELQKRSLWSERRSRALQVLEDQLHHMARLVDDLSDLSRIHRRALRLEVETVDLREVVRRAVSMALPQLQAKRHRTRVELGDDAAWIAADPTRMTQVFSNLLHNAAFYTPTGGEVHVRLDRRRDQLYVTVRDTGEGVAAGAMDQPEPFERGSTDDGPHHAGIGLALVRQIVRMHGGNVSVASDGPGHGSEFVVSLTAASGNEQPTGPAAHEGSRELPQ